MANSQNGWPVVGQSAVIDRAVLGVEFPNGWLKGDVDVIFTYLIGRLNSEVEPIDNYTKRKGLTPGGCWGWHVKEIEGSNTISNHASGTAIDYNAPAHPMGRRNTYGDADRARIRGILADLDGVVRWGGDYVNRPDDMHFEIVKNAAAVKRVADRIKEDDVALTAEDWTRLTKLVEGNRADPADFWNGVSYGRGETRRTVGQILVDARAAALAAGGKADALDIQMDEYASADEARDAALPLQVRDALAAGQPPEQVAAALRQIDGVDWVAVGRILAPQG